MVAKETNSLWVLEWHFSQQKIWTVVFPSVPWSRKGAKLWIKRSGNVLNYLT